MDGTGMQEWFTRDDRWEGWPIDGIEEFAELSDLAVRLVTKAESYGHYNATIQYDGREFSTSYADELRTEAPDLPLEGVTNANFRVTSPADELNVLVILGASSFGDARTNLEVRGRNQTHVLGIHAQLKEEIGRRVDEAAQLQRRRRERIQEKSESAKSNDPTEAPQPTSVRSWLASVAADVGTKVVVGVLVALVLAGLAALAKLNGII